jgi:hypothetical protein
MSVDNLHYHANDLDGLARLAKENPALAKKVVDQRDREDERANQSYRFGLVCATILPISLIISMTFMFVFVGVVATLTSVLLTLAMGVLVRVILTGEWSETSWIGTGLTRLAKALGSKTSDGE